MKLSTLDTLTIVMALMSVVALPVGDVLLSNGHGLIGLFTLLGGGLGIINSIVILSASLLFAKNASL